MANHSFVDTNNHFHINKENIKLQEEELSTELIIKNETIGENTAMEVGEMKNEKPEDDSNDFDSVVSVKQEPVSENDEQLYTINYENIKLEKELNTELIIKDEILDENSILEPHEVHTGRKNQSFLCGICDKTFTQKRYLVQHKRIHTEDKPFECGICNKRFSLQRYLVRHNREKLFPCDICNKQFVNKYSLVRHQRIHTGEKPFICDICNKRFTQKGTLISHKRTHNR
ncbi:zinc finger protein 260-like [Chrysoperla carnea]|uniref:zinc finger protein 260-like n=1 Tax=Chrysoperla carnea TaxID=189513 RepID=UPI001D07414A|nr:zinc finger protein 260-like [Chrysoperla carnea]